jgi:hypothetical protein
MIQVDQIPNLGAYGYVPGPSFWKRNGGSLLLFAAFIFIFFFCKNYKMCIKKIEDEDKN